MSSESLFTRKEDVCISAAVAVFVIFSVSLNIYTIRSIWSTWKPSNFMNPTLRIVFNTSVSDLLYTLFPMIAASASIACHRKIGSGIFAKVICNITGFIFNVTLRHVVLSIAGLGVVRLLAVRRPMHFKRLVGYGTVLSRYVLAMWVLPILVSTVPFFKGITYVYSEYVGLCTWSIDELLPDGPLIVWGHVFLVIIPLMLPGLFILGIYFAIVSELIRLRNKRKRLKRGQNKIGSNAHHGFGLDDDTVKSFSIQGVDKLTTELRQKRLSHATCTTLIVITAFLLCYLPYWLICVEILCKYVKYYYLHQPMTTTFNILFLSGINFKDFSHLIIASYITILANGSINPLIFTLSLIRSKRRDCRDTEINQLTRAHLPGNTGPSRGPLKSRSSRSIENVLLSTGQRSIERCLAADQQN